MLTVKVPAAEYYDENREEFCYTEEVTLQLEHSLISISKWESKWHKPFLGDAQKSMEETVDYIRCMTLNKNVDPEVYGRLPDSVLKEVDDYIKDPMTATWFNDRRPEGSGGPKSREQITNELVYYWMVALNIPFECEKWHLSRLLTLIRVCEAKSQKPKPMSQRDLVSRNASLNAARRAKHHTRG